MWLVLCEPGDRAAVWAHRGLRERGLAPVELVSSGVLALALRWEHRLGNADPPASELRLGDGRTIAGAQVRGTLNRLQAVPWDVFSGAAPRDREYAVQEMTALLMSWLESLPGPVLGRPSGAGLSGAWRHRSEWLMLAARAGLPTPAYAHGADAEQAPAAGAAGGNGAGPRRPALLVVGRRVLGPRAAADLAGPARRLAELAGAGVLEVELNRDRDGGLVFHAASPLPDLSAFGAPALDALHAGLAA